MRLNGSVLVTGAGVVVLAVAIWPRAGAWKCHDGDTCRNRRVTVRVAAIDCPEIGQPYGIEARDLAQRLVSPDDNRALQAEWRQRGRERSYKRVVAWMDLADGRDLGLALARPVPAGRASRAITRRQPT